MAPSITTNYYLLLLLRLHGLSSPAFLPPIFLVIHSLGHLLLLLPALPARKTFPVIATLHSCPSLIDFEPAWVDTQLLLEGSTPYTSVLPGNTGTKNPCLGFALHIVALEDYRHHLGPACPCAQSETFLRVALDQGIVNNLGAWAGHQRGFISPARDTKGAGNRHNIGNSCTSR